MTNMTNRNGRQKVSKRKTSNIAFGRQWIPVVIAMAISLGLLRNGAAQSVSDMQNSVQRESERLRFDVVSVKIDDTGTGGAGDTLPKNGSWRWTRVPLSFLISWAYDVSQNQVGGIPDAFQGPRPTFNILAKMPADVTEAQFRVMLQSLLADRFKFVMHREVRDVEVNTIEIAKSGPRLEATRGECVQAQKSVTVPVGQYRCREVLHRVNVKDGVIVHEYVGRSVSIKDLATALSAAAPVFDNTGIEGLYDIDVKVAVPLATHTDDPVESSNQEFDYHRAFSAAFQNELGLKIDLGKLKRHPVPMIVVDHVELPTAN
jgi:uncharacterized protein (TIGR03435 family)